MTLDEALELLRCSQINFDNLITQNPGINRHPIYRVARKQLDDGVQALGEIDAACEREGRGL